MRRGMPRLALLVLAAAACRFDLDIPDRPLPDSVSDRTRDTPGQNDLVARDGPRDGPGRDAARDALRREAPLADGPAADKKKDAATLDKKLYKEGPAAVDQGAPLLKWYQGKACNGPGFVVAAGVDCGNDKIAKSVPAGGTPPTGWDAECTGAGMPTIYVACLDVPKEDLDVSDATLANSALCASGYKTVGGGCECGTSTAKIALTASVPSSSQWNCTCQGGAPAASVHAVCLDESTGYTLTLRPSCASDAGFLHMVAGGCQHSVPLQACVPATMPSPISVKCVPANQCGLNAVCL